MEKNTSNITILVGVISAISLLSNMALAQELNAPNDSSARAELGEFHPVIRGAGSSDALFARQITWKNGGSERKQFVIINRAANQAIVADSTNEVCFFKGRLFTALPNGPSQSVFINNSQPFGTNEFGTSQASNFVAAIANYHSPSNFNRKLVELKPLLQTEFETSHSAIGTPIRHVELAVENGKLVLLFESFTHMKGKVILDDQLNPVSMAVMPSTNSPPK